MSENDLSRKIRELRTKQGLTFEQIAQAVGVGRSTVRKWETGLIENMRRDKIAKLAAALHTTPAYLMGWEENTTESNEAIRVDDDLIAADEGRNILRLAGRDGYFKEKVLSDEQMAALRTIIEGMPDAPDDI